MPPNTHIIEDSSSEKWGAFFTISIIILSLSLIWHFGTWHLQLQTFHVLPLHPPIKPPFSSLDSLHKTLLKHRHDGLPLWASTKQFVSSKHTILSRCDYECKRSPKNSQNVRKKIYVPFGVHQSLRAIDKGSPVYVFFLHLFVTVSVYMWKSEDNFRKSILLFNHMGFKD